MTTKLQNLIEASQELSPLERLKLITAVSESLYRSQQRWESALDDWEPKTLDEIPHIRRADPVTNLADLAADFWPTDESADEVITYIYQQRFEDRASDL